MNQLKLQIIDQSDFEISNELYGRSFDLLSKILVAEKVINFSDPKELSCVFLNQSEAKKINFNFRKKNYATDVLSFESIEPDSAGELVFCVEVIESQAKENNHSFDDELIYLTLHGLLHLLGYEHEEGGDAEREMMALQDKVWELYLSQNN